MPNAFVRATSPSPHRGRAETAASAKYGQAAQLRNQLLRSRHHFVAGRRTEHVAATLRDLSEAPANGAVAIQQELTDQLSIAARGQHPLVVLRDLVAILCVQKLAGRH